MINEDDKYWLSSVNTISAIVQQFNDIHSLGERPVVKVRISSGNRKWAYSS